MDYEKAYKDALKRAKDCHVNENLSELVDNAQQLCEYIFPELKVNDEMIREELIKFIKQEANSATLNANRMKFKSMLTWLEKQGEQNSADSYCKDNCKGFQEIGKCFADGECKAKRDAENKPTQEIESFEAEHGKYYYCIKDYFCGGRKQASKGDVVQALRGLPIMSLKDASEYFLPVNNIQKPAWSEEDEKMLNRVKQSLYRYQDHLIGSPLADDVEMEINWLESLKPQPHWKPTDGQMQALELVVQYHAFADQDNREKIVALFNDLKKL